MKSAKIKEILKAAAAAITAVSLFGALLLGANHLTLNAATNEEVYSPPATEYVSIPDNPVPLAYNQSQGLTVIDVSMGMGDADPLALSPEDAAQIGAQYILDIFGECIDGMYVDMDFWPQSQWTTRSFWHGAVSSSNRYVIERNEYVNARIEEFVRVNPEGSDDQYTLSDENGRIFFDPNGYWEYIPATFYFAIDAVTGERIEIRHHERQMRGTTADDQMAIRQALMAMTDAGYAVPAIPDVTFSDQEKDVLLQIAYDYGQRQFTNTTVEYVDFIGAGNSIGLDDDGEIIVVTGFASVDVTDCTGRVAMINICLETMQVTSIDTMRNDVMVFAESVQIVEGENTPRVQRRIYVDGEWVGVEEVDATDAE